MKLIILGPQASGKGTQAEMLSDELNIPHISTGDILRQNIKEMTELGKQASAYTNKGELVPDELINKVIEDKLGQRSCERGFILDGFPRNTLQANALDHMTDLDFAIEIFVSDAEAIKRISGRRTCEKCGSIYSIYQSSEEDLAGACEKCGGRLIIRDDDKEESIKKRLEIYHEETEPLVKFYENKGILMKINGERSIDAIFNEMIKKLKN